MERRARPLRQVLQRGAWPAAGFKGGRVVGASDDTGANVAERPVYPLGPASRSMYTLLGIDPDGPLPNPKGLDVKVLPLEKDQKSGGILKEIM